MPPVFPKLFGVPTRGLATPAAGTLALGSLLYGASGTAVSHLAPNTAATLKVLTQTGTGSAGQAPAWAAFDGITPSQTGNSGKFLTTNGSAASWATVTASAAGSSGQLQYNSSGSFAGAAALVYATSGTNLTVTATAVSTLALKLNPNASESTRTPVMLALATSYDGNAAITFPYSGKINIGYDGMTITVPNAGDLIVQANQTTFPSSAFQIAPAVLTQDITVIANNSNGHKFIFQGNGDYNFLTYNGTYDCFFNVRQTDGTGKALVGIGVNNTSPTSQLDVRATNAATKATSIRGYDSQSAVMLQLQGKSSTTDGREQVDIDTAWATSTDASRKARGLFRVWDTAAREAIRIEASGSEAMLGFYGVSATARQLLATGAGATVDNVITALQTLGLVKQS